MEAPDTAMPDHALRWRTDLSVFLWMLVLAVAAYAPVACMQYALKWDMVDCYLPWRHFAADAFAHGTFPLWDPYQSLGYPIYGDLRSVFYPDALFAGIFLGGFGVRTLHVLFIVHLALAGTGMYLLAGHFARRTAAVAPAATVRLRLEMDDVAWELTGPMRCALVTPDEKRAVTARLGPDPLRRNADPTRFRDRVLASAKPIGLLLMEQDVIAGVGNVYRSEVLNIVGIDPRRPGRSLHPDEVDAIWAEVVRQLRLGVRRNRIVTMDRAELSKPISRLLRGEGRYVYKQERCGRCGTELDVFDVAGRTAWSCPTCQPG